MLSSILIIYTGGTIGMKTDPATGVLVPFDFRGIYDEFPAIRSLQVRIDVQSLTPVIDSSNVTPALWLHLAELIRDNYARYDGFVVLHGTDTMSYTASALSFLLENLAKPGRLHRQPDPRSAYCAPTDARTLSRRSKSPLRTTRRGRSYPRCRSTSRTGCSAPTAPSSRAPRSSPHSAPTTIRRWPKWASISPSTATTSTARHTPTPNSGSPQHWTTACWSSAFFPGLREQVLRAMLSIEGLRAVVLETYGAGNAPTAPEFIRAVREAVARGLLVMNVTQCSGGSGSPWSSTKPAGSCRRPASSAATTSPPKRPSPN